MTTTAQRVQPGQTIVASKDILKTGERDIRTVERVITSERGITCVFADPEKASPLATTGNGWRKFRPNSKVEVVASTA